MEAQAPAEALPWESRCWSPPRMDLAGTGGTPSGPGAPHPGDPRPPLLRTHTCPQKALRGVLPIPDRPWALA